MARKVKKTKSASHKQQKSELARKQAIKDRLKKQQKRRPQAAIFLEEAADLYDDGAYEDVCDLIREELALNPRAESIDALELLGQAAIQLDDSPTIARTFRRLSERLPSEIHFQVNYAAGLMRLMLPKLALQAFEQVLQRWPNDPLCESIQKTVRDLQGGVESIYAAFPWNESDRDKLAILHEEMLYGVGTNDFQHTIKYGEKLLPLAPTFPPAFNNLALAYREAGQAAKAVALCEELLARDPANPHAIVILGDSLYAQGKRTEAREVWSRLQTLDPQYQHRDDYLTRQIEALARLGEYEAVLGVLESAEQQNLLRSPDLMNAVAYHLAALAASRLGQHFTASQHWTRALEINPSYSTAAENREDHEQPLGEREGPWIENRLIWFPRDLALGRSLEAGVRAILGLYPELPDLIGDALQMSSPESRELAIMICQESESAELLERLREFAFSPHGSDNVRMGAALWLRQKGVITDDNVTLWSKGKPTELTLLSAKITYEATNSISPEVDKLHSQAFAMLNAGQFAEAEKQYRECLAIAGDNPTLLFNLSTAIDNQRGRVAEAAALRADIIQRWPDYFFGKIHLVQQAIHQKDYEQAEQLLGALSKREQFHVSEFAMLGICYVEVELRRGRPEAARSWLEQVRQVDPDNPNLPMIDRELNRSSFSLRSLFSGLLGR